VVNYLHLLIIHASAWVSIIVAADVHKNGAPSLGGIKALLVKAGVLGLAMGLLTAHAHSHYLQYLQ
jgi:hypothetical protein